MRIFQDNLSNAAFIKECLHFTVLEWHKIEFPLVSKTKQPFWSCWWLMLLATDIITTSVHLFVQKRTIE